jgi:transglycosylase-like protein with SLT domain
VEDGIKAYEHGDLDYARSHLQFAGELLMLSDLAPRGTSLLQPAELFRGIMGELPSRLRTFDFARALEASPAAQHHASLQGLSNSEYIGHEVRRIAIELGQDENVPSGFVEKVELFVRQDAGDPAFQGVIDRSASTQGRLRGLFAEAHLPELFCYIPWVESELVPTATSRDGARGLWQFSEMTGRLYGLRIDTRAGIDERINVVESTRAATRYIGYLFRKFGREQFMCALASYNRGDAAVFAALSKIPDPMLPSSLRYWYLVEHDLLPAETREYVPRVFATRILAENPERFGLKRP